MVWSAVGGLVLATLLLGALFLLDRKPASSERLPEPVLRPTMPAPAEQAPEAKVQERPVEPSGLGGAGPAGTA